LPLSEHYSTQAPIPVPARLEGVGLRLAWITGSNSAEGTEVCLSWVVCVVR